jgi:site-specific DNA-methyltransferase (adenine-specific)
MTGCDIKQGNCLDILPALEANSVDSIVTDPPYGLNFMGKDWDHGVPGVQFWVEALRVAKPGAHLLAFGGTRTFHRLTCAIEDAGWEIRDCVMWVYAQGFPKSLDVSKAIDKTAGTTREVIGIITEGRAAKPRKDIKGGGMHAGSDGDVRGYLGNKVTAPATEAACQWDGWGTALKPAWEPIILARKPIKGTVVDNVLRYGTGALNIDGCRVKGQPHHNYGRTCSGGMFTGKSDTPINTPDEGRFPANIIHDGSDEVLGLFPITSSTKPHSGNGNKLDTREQGWGFKRMPCSLSDNGGSAARFFYCAKASKKDRDEGCGGLEEKMVGMSNGAQIHGEEYDKGKGIGLNVVKAMKNHHPTVKPVALMRYICRLVTPPGGIVLDPFMGSGSTGKAALLEGFKFIGIELEKEYVEIAKRRINVVQPLFVGVCA